MKLYLDTSVISGYFAEDNLDMQASTIQFFERAANNTPIKLYISDLVLTELDGTTNLKKRSKLRFIRDLSR